MQLKSLRALALAIVVVLPACTVGGDPSQEPEEDVLPVTGPAHGGFHGVARCNDVIRKIDLSLVQAAADSDVDGRVFVETNVRYVDGLVDIVLPHVVAGELVDGELEDGSLTGIVLTETVDNRASAPDFSIAFEMETDALGIASSFTGTLAQLDGNNAPVVECDATLVPVDEERPSEP